MRRVARLFVFIIIITFALGFDLQTAKACESCACSSQAHAQIRAWESNYDTPFNYDWIGGHFQNYIRNMFTVQYFFKEHIVTAMRIMTDHITAAGLQEMIAIGGMMDAKNQMNAERLFREKAAEAHRDYAPDIQMCTFGTVARNLYKSNRFGVANANVLAQRSRNRQLHSRNTSSFKSVAEDRANRVRQFRMFLCNKFDGAGDLAKMCKKNLPSDPEDLAKVSALLNRDVNYTATIYAPESIQIDFTDDQVSDDENAVTALSSNLFAHDLPGVIPREKLLSGSGENQDELLDLRSIVAKRSVAEYSFNTIAGMKAARPSDEKIMGKYVRAVLRQMGIPEGETPYLIPNVPSYDGLMEVLTKKIYQSPEFYTNLYQNPTGLERKGAAMRAIGLMQDMDMFKSRLRNEAMLAVLVELETIKLQRAVAGASPEQTEGPSGEEAGP